MPSFQSGSSIGYKFKTTRLLINYVLKLYVKMGDEKKNSSEEVAKMAPHYKGKPENFNPAKLGQGKRKAQNTAKPPPVQQQRVSPPPITKLPTPELLHQNTNPTPQKNHSLLEESIFGCEVTEHQRRTSLQHMLPCLRK